MGAAYLKSGLLGLFFLLCLTGWSQTKTISGTIISEVDKKPLPGVSVTIKGSPGGTQTNAEGQYSIEAATGNVLVFSYTGFAVQEVTVGNATNINISMLTSEGNWMK